MPLTLDDLTKAYIAAHDGVAPDSAASAQLSAYASQISAGTTTDKAALAYVVTTARSTTAVAETNYNFFTGKSPTKAGLDYLVNSPTNSTDLNDSYYGQFNIENRYINFAINLGITGEGAASFATAYGSLSYTNFIASIYETIVGSSFARAAGIDPAAAQADIAGRQGYFITLAMADGVISSKSTAAQVDLAAKAATVGYLLAEGIKADVGFYASASDNFASALVAGTAIYNVPLVTTYAGTPSAPGTPASGAGSTGLTFALVVGQDQLSGSAGNDTFNATDATLEVGDNLDGGPGADTLNVAITTGAYTAGNFGLQNIETVNFTGNGSLTVDGRLYGGTTQLNLTGVGAVAATAANATNVGIVSTQRGTATVTDEGGASVSIAATGSTTGGITVGGATAPVGAVTISNTTAAGVFTAGPITVTGGTSVSVTQIASGTINATQANANVTVNGSALTTTVSSTQTAAATASPTVAGIAAGSLTVTDINNGSTTLAGKITTVAADGYSGVTIGDNALSALSLGHASGNVTINDGGLTTPTNKTLTLSLNGLTGGTVTESANIYTTLNVATSGTASTVQKLAMSGVTKLALSGSQVLTITDFSGLSAVTAITETGSAGLSADLSAAALAVTQIDASASSGTNTLTLDGTFTSYTGGGGVDVVTLINGSTKAISLGGGNDTLLLADGTSAPTVALSGGSGVDTLGMLAADAATASASGAFATLVTGFETLAVRGGAGNQTIDLAALGGFTGVSTGGEAAGGTLTLKNLPTAGTLTLTSDAGAGSTYAITNAAFAASTTDVLNLQLAKAGLLNAGTVQVANVESIVVTTSDTQTTPTNPLDTLTLKASSATSITVSGNAGLNLTANATTLTSVDASGVTAGGFTFTSGALAASATIKGSATGTNTVDFQAANAIVTYAGGSGDDVINASNGKANVIVLGAGNNTVTGAGGAMTITGGSGNDTVTLTSGANIVVLGDGTNILTVGNGANTITGGGGADTVTVGSGANMVSLGAGTNSFTAGNGANTYVGGANVDTVTVGSGVNSLTTGAGADKITITAPTANVTTFSTVLDAHSGESIGFAVKGMETFNSLAVTPAGGTTLQNYADAAIAAAGDGSVNGAIGWFQFGGDTYIVESQSAAHATFSNGSDFIIKLAGAVNLSTATVVSHALLLG